MPRKNSQTLATVALLLSVLVSGCSVIPERSAAPEKTAASEPSKSAEYYFYPNGSATDNLPVFESLMVKSGAGKPNHDLAKSIALLVETGFEIEDVTHTEIESKIGASVDSVSLAVAFGGECLISQFSSTWLTTKVAGKLASGCLIGDVVNASLEPDNKN